MATQCRHFYFVRINISKLQQEAEARKHDVKPLPKVSLGKISEGIGKGSDVARKISAETPSEARDQVRQHHDAVVEKDSLLKELWAEISRIKTDRGKLSTQTANLVTGIAQRLLAEHPSQAKAFMAGEIPMPELADHYAKIEALTDQAGAVWEKIRHVEQYGKPPADPEPVARPLELDSPEISALQYQVRRLDDRIHKSMKKLRTKTPKNPSRVALWRSNIALDEAKREELKRKIKQLQYDARTQRPGEGQL